MLRQVDRRTFDEIRSRLFSERDRVRMNLFELIEGGDAPLLGTDGASILFGQSNDHAPLWLWLRKNAPADAFDEAAKLLYERALANPGLHFNAEPDAVQPALELLRDRYGLCAEVVMPMNAYACPTLHPAISRGRLLSPADEHQDTIAALLSQLAEDGEHSAIPAQAARSFAEAMVGSSKLFLWAAESGEIVSMAMLAHQGGGMARINTVVTDRSHRGSGYAGMLVSAMCAPLLRAQTLPMLYADAHNPASNRAYQKIGFVPFGSVTEYRLERTVP